ncbi:MAG: F0F1 ATP synthase subunit beta, partial [Candidatus Woesebacteria bacterium]
MQEKQSTGKIIGIKGSVVEIEFLGESPTVNDVLVLKEDPQIKMQVYSSSSPSSFYCIALGSPRKLYRGAEVDNTFEQLAVPVGASTLGRVMDVFGNP